ncbi:hypothetical protein [Endozoicomonas sp. YOMI1]|nr:hypothetical protein [Endozoicomonas sp. YOMI1]
MAIVSLKSNASAKEHGGVCAKAVAHHNTEVNRKEVLASGSRRDSKST